MEMFLKGRKGGQPNQGMGFKERFDLGTILICVMYTDSNLWLIRVSKIDTMSFAGPNTLIYIAIHLHHGFTGD